MEKDFSKLLPALFNDKDICLCDWMENFFEEFDGTFCSNSQGDTFVGFIKEHEVYIHSVVNRLEIKFNHCSPSDELLEKVADFLSFSEDDCDGPYISNIWKEDENTIIAQYYWNPI